ncbi:MULTISPECIES: peptidoglycan-binding protein [unclassified Beijerinckia]|uniref:peptidoglycan recognition protein family protein n=1 Tax=unclassified Beijerinckia TaxID=2638183 RepID=UPI00089D30A2|nr:MULTISPECIES: peptidoglycan-binding protein [unclassified Beijerinckia]MDH7794138.1 N-acetyl-anhydromuramyl-L-alanine amidase AmpD [Beijerinckia sp. GAS462]SEB54130.1 N-acetylmuramoyl-L-alanine amidase [Beijerinckia sp. 28-YEA-48]
MNVEAIQRALVRAGFEPGLIDGKLGPKTIAAIKAFQKAHALLVDGIAAQITQAALSAYAVPSNSIPSTLRLSLVPSEWMPAATMKRVIVHWTAGAHKASALDMSHYHVLIEDDGRLVRGKPSIVLNDAHGTKAGYAAHTLNCNTGSIGASLCCMAGAIESPFKAGSAPMTRVQWEQLPHVVADLCQRYQIPVTLQTVLSHAEVQGNLGIKQRGKWDISRLAFDPSLVGAKACGDALRTAVSVLLD